MTAKAIPQRSTPQSAGLWSPGPQARPHWGLPPSLFTQSPQLLPETLSAALFPRPQRTRVSRLPKSGPPSLPPGTPSHGVPPTPESARHPHFPPGPRRLPVRPNFSRPRPGPRSGGDSRPEPRRARGLALPLPLPAQPARVALGTSAALGPRRSAGRGGGAGVAGTALSQRPHSRRPRRCAAPSPPARGRLTSSRAAAAATAGNTWQWPPPLALLASPLLSAPARAAPARRTTAPGALCRREAESSRPNPNSPAAPARRPAPGSRQPRPWPGPKSR